MLLIEAEKNNKNKISQQRVLSLLLEIKTDLRSEFYCFND